jgi:membrane peptidoglycan carboxypeptidase
MSHPGVDRDAVARAAIQTLRGESHSGASTLTMQIAKDLRDGTGRRSTTMQKLGDMVTALRIEREFSKEEILLKYVNMPYFGRGQYGIEAASRAYFGKPVKELGVQHVAFLVSLINRPALPDRSFANDHQLKDPKEIRNANWQEVLRGTRRVLARMREDGLLDEFAYARAALAVDSTLQKDIIERSVGCGATDYFLEHVRVLYKDRFPINKGGLTVSITRDDALQEVLKKAVQTTMATYLARHPNDADNAELRAGAFAVEFTGDVLAEVGNADFSRQKYDVIANGWRQPGSTFKAFTYGGLVEQLAKDVLSEEKPPTTVEDITREVLKRCKVLDAPIYVSLGRGRGAKKIENFHSLTEAQYRGEISCEVALGESRNTAAMRAGSRAGIKNIIDLTYRLGMPRDARHMLQPYPTTAIGASEVNPLAMAGTASFLNGGFRVTPRFASDVCKDGRSLLYNDDTGRPRACDFKGQQRPAQERVLHPAVSAAMVELLKAPLDTVMKEPGGQVHATGTASALRHGTIPGLDPLGGEIWKLKPEEKSRRSLSFPMEEAGEIAGKTGTATNADGKTSDVWLLLFVPGPPDRPEKGVMLGFWMGKDSKDHPLGERGATGGPGFAESGGRNWVPSAAAVLAFLQKERGLLKPGHRFVPIMRDEALLTFDARQPSPAAAAAAEADASAGTLIDPADPATDPQLLKTLPTEPAAKEPVASKTSPAATGFKD